MKKHNLNSLALRAEILNIRRLQAGIEPLIDFNELVADEVVSLSDFELNKDFEADKNTGYDVYAELILTPRGYRTLLKKYPHLRDCINDEWDVFITNEYIALKGGAK